MNILAAILDIVNTDVFTRPTQGGTWVWIV